LVVNSRDAAVPFLRIADGQYQNLEVEAFGRAAAGDVVEVARELKLS
jgi:hypothetical protein